MLYSPPRQSYDRLGSRKFPYEASREPVRSGKIRSRGRLYIAPDVCRPRRRNLAYFTSSVRSLSVSVAATLVAPMSPVASDGTTIVPALPRLSAMDARALRASSWSKESGLFPGPQSTLHSLWPALPEVSTDEGTLLQTPVVAARSPPPLPRLFSVYTLQLENHRLFFGLSLI